MPSKKHSKTMLTRARKIAKGLLFIWQDATPELDSKSRSELIGFSIGHKNPVNRLLAGDIVKSCTDWLFNHAKFHWDLSVMAVFEYDTGTDKHGAELSSFGTLTDINTEFLTQCAEAKKRGAEDKFSHFEFTAEITGLNPPPPVEHQISKLMAQA